MPYEGDPIQDAVDVLWLAVIGVAVYLLYEVYQLGQNFSLCDLLPDGTIKSALGCLPANTVLDQQLQQAGGQAGGVGGYDCMDTIGQQWSCTGPPSNMCLGVKCDSNANCTPTGVKVPQSSIQGCSQGGGTLIGSEPS